MSQAREFAVTLAQQGDELDDWPTDGGAYECLVGYQGKYYLVQFNEWGEAQSYLNVEAEDMAEGHIADSIREYEAKKVSA